MDNITKILWITGFFTYTLNIIKFIRNPINYSNKEVFLINQHNFQFLIEILIIVFFTLFLRKLIISNPINIKQNYIYLLPIINLLILINYKRKIIKDKEKFFLPPKNISSSINLILILNIICLSTLLYYTKNNLLYPIILINIYQLNNTYNFSACKFDLPSTFNKK